MAGVRTIYLSDEINEKLKNVKNISGLIQELLTKHFMSFDKRVENMTIEELKKRKLDIENKINDSEVENEIKILDEIVKEKTITKEEKEEKEEKEKNKRLESYKDWIKHFFIVNETEIQELVEMYEEEKENYDSLFEWGMAKKLTERKKQEEQ